MDQYISFFSNHALLSAAWVAIVVALIFTTVKMQFSPVKQVSPQDLTFLVNRQEGIVVDIRTEKSFAPVIFFLPSTCRRKKLTTMTLAALKKIKINPLLSYVPQVLLQSRWLSSLPKLGFSQVNLLKGV